MLTHSPGNDIFRRGLDARAPYSGSLSISCWETLLTATSRWQRCTSSDQQLSLWQFCVVVVSGSMRVCMCVLLCARVCDKIQQRSWMYDEDDSRYIKSHSIWWVYSCSRQVCPGRCTLILQSEAILTAGVAFQNKSTVRSSVWGVTIASKNIVSKSLLCLM